MPILSIDFETRSTVDLRQTGVYPYARHPDTGIWCMAWAFDDEEPQVWGEGDPFPERVAEHVAAGGEIRAWNANFERVMWRDCAVPRYGFPPARMEQFVCTAVEAAEMGLPRDLFTCSRVLKLGVEKDAQGHALMLRMCRPRSVKGGEVVWWNIPDRVQRLKEYCATDVRTEQAIGKVLRRLEPSEREAYLLDQRINDRGVQIDVELVSGLRAVAEQAIDRSTDTLIELTSGRVTSATKTGQLRTWLAEQGVETDGVAKKHVKELLDGELAYIVRQVLEVRQEAGKSSVAKLKSITEALGHDDRIRGMLFFYGASTGRWAGRLVQPQNFPRPSVDNPEQFLPLARVGDHDLIDLSHPPLEVVASLLRGTFVPAPGHKYVGADFSAIEARVLNWMAGQEDVLERFRRYDAGDKTQDPYVVNAMRLYQLPFESVLKFPHRQTGKFQELGCGYGMGKVKARTAAKDVYGLELSAAEAEAIVTNYRETHSKVVDWWYALDRAATQAVANPGMRVDLGKLVFKMVGPYLWVRLPSGRSLCYPGPHFSERETPWGEMRNSLHAFGVNSQTRQWGVYSLYGGLWAENIVQAVSRDLLVNAMHSVEAEGYPVVLTVHDEILTEPAATHGSADHFTSIITQLPGWAEGLPFAAEAWEGERYGK